MTKIIGKRLANRYDLKRVNVKQKPSSGEDVEKSALIEDRSVSNTSGGQQKSFRQTSTNTSTNAICRFQTIKTDVLLIFSFITGDKTEFLLSMMFSNEYITGI